MHHPLAHLTRDRWATFVPALIRAARAAEGGALDLGMTESVDATGAALLRKLYAEAEPRFHVTNAAPKVMEALAHFNGAAPVQRLEAAPLTPLQRVGDWAQGVFELVWACLAMSGAVLVALARSGFRRPKIFGQEEARHMLRMGPEALPVVALIAFLVGVTVAMQSAAQLRQFGAGLLVADLIGVAVTRELGPLMAAILVAGRSGSAIAAELSTMVITEELDALKVMGLTPERDLVLPRLVAMVCVQPLLTLLANSVAIFGGLCVAVVYLDLSPGAFMDRLRDAVTLKDLLTGLLKSGVFAWLTVITAAVSGLRTVGGPDAVGVSTTRSVVIAIFCIIVADAALSLTFYFGA